MDKATLIEFIDRYYESNKLHDFYIECKKKLEVCKDIIHKLPRKAHYVETLRLFLINQKKYNVFLSRTKPTEQTYVVLKLSDLELSNLLIQLTVTENYSSNVLKFTKNELDLKFKKGKKTGKNILYIVISHINSDSDYKIKNNDSLGYILGIESIKILKFQRIDRIIEHIKNKDSRGGYERLQKYNEYMRGHNDKNNSVIYGDALLEAIGLSYTNNVDIIVLNDNCSRSDKINTEFNREFNFNFVCKEDKFLSLLGIDDIYKILANPAYHFVFMGMKFLGLKQNITYFLQKVESSTFADLIMLKKLNKYKLSGQLCLPNMTIKKGKIEVFFGDYLENFYKKIQTALKLKYNENTEINELKNIIVKCAEVPDNTIYTGKMVKDKDTGIIKYFHITVKESILTKFAKNSKYLLDVGTGKFTDLFIWAKLNIQNVVGIEPSQDSIEKAQQKIEKEKPQINIKLIKGFGDELWIDKKNIYNDALVNVYDVITFQFCIHYMMKNIDIVLANIQNLSKKGTKVIISCMDGNKIKKDIEKYGKIEIRNNYEPIFAIIPTNQSFDEILVYFKGAYGVANGSVEPIVDINFLLNKFIKSDFKLIFRQSFVENNSHVKNKMSPIQKLVSSYYLILVLEKN